MSFNLACYRSRKLIYFNTCHVWYLNVCNILIFTLPEGMNVIHFRAYKGILLRLSNDFIFGIKQEFEISVTITIMLFCIIKSLLCNTIT